MGHVSVKYSTNATVNYNLLQVLFQNSEGCEDSEFEGEQSVPVISWSKLESAASKDGVGFGDVEFVKFTGP